MIDTFILIRKLPYFSVSMSSSATFGAFLKKKSEYLKSPQFAESDKCNSVGWSKAKPHEMVAITLRPCKGKTQLLSV